MRRPTEEQLIAVEKFKAGRPLKITAFAGAGKTTTLQLLASSRRSRGLYLAFNKAIATEARERFPRSVDCRTTHAIAFRAIMPAYRSQAKMTESLFAPQLAQLTAYKDRVFAGTIRLTPVQQAHLVLGTVKKFCQSADESMMQAHVPRSGRLLGAREAVLADVCGWALEQSSALWKRMTTPRDPIPLGHDGYLKLWALAHPKLRSEYILLDEAQDTNPVVLGVLQEQHAQIVYVGDKHQQIYEWRGAINAMEKITGCEEVFLTQSFRFGDEIAGAASRVLATLGEQHRLRGNPTVSSRIAPAGDARAVLARTNATVILEILEATSAGRKACVVGGTKDLTRLLSDVYELKKGQPGTCPEFFGFPNWRDVVEFADTEEGESIRTFVQLVEKHGEGKLWAAVKKAHDDEDSADVVLSTAHKAKGREWGSVRLSSDFSSSRLGPGAAAEVRLFYVAMTRAKNTLIVDNATLSTFTTDAWKTRTADHHQARPPERGAQRRPEPARHPQPRPRPAPVREVIAPIVREQHPGAAGAEAPKTASPRPFRPEPPPAHGSLSREIREPNSTEVRKKHPGVALDGAPGASGGADEREPHRASRSDRLPAAPPPKLWKRLARLFGA